MSPFLRLLAKEFTEIRRTWRLPTFGGVLLFFAVMSPIAALATPALVSSLTAGQPGLVIKVPDPTYLDSYAQWVKNLSQMGLMLVLFGSAGLIANERQSGTAILVATKPVSRQAFAVAKYVAQAALVAACTLLGTAVTLVGTHIAFGEAPASRLLAASGAWLVAALVAVAFVEALSAVMPTLAAGIVGLVTWGLCGAVSLWEPAARFSPIGLLGAPATLLAGDKVELLWPLLTAAVLVVALVALAGALFARREL